MKRFSAQIWRGFQHKYDEGFNTNMNRFSTQIWRGFQHKYKQVFNTNMKKFSAQIWRGVYWHVRLHLDRNPNWVLRARGPWAPLSLKRQQKLFSFSDIGYMSYHIWHKVQIISIDKLFEIKVSLFSKHWERRGLDNSFSWLQISFLDGWHSSQLKKMTRSDYLARYFLGQQCLFHACRTLADARCVIHKQKSVHTNHCSRDPHWSQSWNFIWNLG